MTSPRLSAEQLALCFNKFLKDDKETLSHKCGGTWPVNYCHDGEISYRIGETHFEVNFNGTEGTYTLTVINDGRTLFRKRKMKYSSSGRYVEDCSEIFHTNVREAKKEFEKSTNRK